MISTKDKVPGDYYNFLLHKLKKFVADKCNENTNNSEDISNEGSYLRLHNFIWNRSHIKKTVMTIPYNSGIISMKNYLLETLVYIKTEDNVAWYSYNSDNTENLVNVKDIFLLIRCIKNIISNDFFLI